MVSVSVSVPDIHFFLSPLCPPTSMTLNSSLSMVNSFSMMPLVARRLRRMSASVGR
jgi:hypothetical protein